MFANGCKPVVRHELLLRPDMVELHHQGVPGQARELNHAPGRPTAAVKPRRCVVKAPGFSPNVIADGIATAIGNCSDIKPNSCSKYACTNANLYDKNKPGRVGTPGRHAVKESASSSSSSSRTGRTRTRPRRTPCPSSTSRRSTSPDGQAAAAPVRTPARTRKNLPLGDTKARVDEDTAGGDIAGYFVGYALPDAPGDPNSVCVIGQLKPCTPVLVR